MSMGITSVTLVFVVMPAAATSQHQARVKGNRAPLPAEPMTTSTALAHYQAGATLQVLETANGWGRVRDPQTEREGSILGTLVLPPPGAAPGRSATAASAAPASWPTMAPSTTSGFR